MATKTETNVVYVAGLVQGIVLVSSPAASTIFTDPKEYDLSSSQYGAMFLPQVITAIGAALLGTGWPADSGPSACVRHHPATSERDRRPSPTSLSRPTSPGRPSTVHIRRSSAMTIKDQVAIVTGGNSGIGMGIVLALAEQGANVVIDYVANPEATEELERRCHALGDQAIGVKADVSKVADLLMLVDTAVKTFGKLDVMVNNAGIETRTSILDTTEEQYQRVLDVNLKSAFFGTQIAAKQMIAQGTGGRIINISSVHEDWPMPGNTPYCVSKGGMRMLTRSAGVELAPYGVLVIGVGPGAVDTPINAATEADPEAMKRLDAAIPIGRMADPKEISSVIAFLASPAASYLAATTIFVDGGIMHSSPGL
jgi:glucose 1-dehydrogenase